MKAIIAIPAIVGLVHRAWSRNSLTPLGIFAAALTAIAHAVHPWSAPFALLCVFYLSGTKVTKVKHGIKARLTLSATGAEGGEGSRTHIQVLANSIVATVLILCHTYLVAKSSDQTATTCFSCGRRPTDVFVVGIVANYAAVAADTFSSELGILSKSKPRLITSPTLRVVPPGTNGGVTATGLLAGTLGAFIISVTSALLLPFCDGQGLATRAQWVLAFTACGTLGSVLDSVLGGLLQASVVDKRTGKVIEGAGGEKVLVHPTAKPGGSTGLGTAGSSRVQADDARRRKSEKETEPAASPDTGQESRRVESGVDLLDNNAVNVLMAFTMSVGAMAVASWTWGIPIHELI